MMPETCRDGDPKLQSEILTKMKEHIMSIPIKEKIRVDLDKLLSAVRADSGSSPNTTDQD